MCGKEFDYEYGNTSKKPVKYFQDQFAKEKGPSIPTPNLLEKNSVAPPRIKNVLLPRGDLHTPRVGGTYARNKLHVMMSIVIGKRKLSENLRHNMIATVMHTWTCCCTMLHVMIFICNRKQRICENQFHVMIAIAIRMWTRCCAMLHVMICVLALIAIQNTPNHNAKCL